MQGSLLRLNNEMAHEAENWSSSCQSFFTRICFNMNFAVCSIYKMVVESVANKKKKSQNEALATS